MTLNSMRLPCRTRTSPSRSTMYSWPCRVDARFFWARRKEARARRLPPRRTGAIRDRTLATVELGAASCVKVSGTCRSSLGGVVSPSSVRPVNLKHGHIDVVSLTMDWGGVPVRPVSSLAHHRFIPRKNALKSIVARRWCARRGFGHLAMHRTRYIIGPVYDLGCADFVVEAPGGLSNR